MLYARPLACAELALGRTSRREYDLGVDPVRRFDGRYEEELVLAEGTRVRLRLLRPEDRELVRQGFSELSLRSRYRRFLTSKVRLSDRELDYLTELDQDRHFALGAVAVDAAGHEHGVGIARFVRSPERPEIAEPAVVVVDRLHGRGLGRILCERLAEAARERGVTAFRCEVLASNTPMRALIDSLSPHAQVEQHGDAATIEFALNAPAPTPPTDPGPPHDSAEPSPSPSPSPNMINYLLRQAGRGAMIMLHRTLARWMRHEA